MKRLILLVLTAFLAAFAAAVPAHAAGTVNFKGQGLIADEFGGYDLRTELCGVENGADVDGPYLLFVLTAGKSATATITGPFGTEVPMTKMSNGSFKYISAWYDPDDLMEPGAVSAWYSGNDKNPQLVVSHGCRPFNDEGAWCSPGFWKNAAATASEKGPGAWSLVAPTTAASLFNDTVVSAFYGEDLGSDLTLGMVLAGSGNTYGKAVAGTDPRTQPPNDALNPYNATGAYLTDLLPGFAFDPEVMKAGGSDACPIDHFGNLKEDAEG